MDKRKETLPLVLLKKSNNLITSIGKSTLLSNKVFLTALLRIEDRRGVPEGQKPYYQRLEASSGTDFTTGLVAEFCNAELRHIMGTNSGSYYNQISELMDPQSPKSLRNQWVVMVKNKEDGLYGTTDVITSTLYDDKNGKLYIKFSSEKKIRDELYNLKNNYTLLNYGLMMQFKSTYSFRIYELLMSRIGYQDGIMKEKRDVYSFTYNLSELKYLLGVLDPYINKDVRIAIQEPNPDYEKIETMLSTEHVMPRYNDFKKYTLVKAKEEIDVMTDFIFEYNPIRNGRGGKVVGVELLMKRKKSLDKPLKEKIYNEDEKDEIIEEIQDLIPYKLKIRECRNIAVAANYDLQKVKKAYAVLEGTDVEINNVVGFLIKAIQDNYEPPKKKAATKKKKNSFNDIEMQHDYDFALLESEILSN